MRRRGEWDVMCALLGVPEPGRHRQGGPTVRRLAMLTADAIDVGIAVVTAPAKWAAQGLRWCAAQGDDSPGRPSAAEDPDEPVRPA
jgi:hypothetical protein